MPPTPYAIRGSVFLNQMWNLGHISHSSEILLMSRDQTCFLSIPVGREVIGGRVRGGGTFFPVLRQLFTFCLTLFIIQQLRNLRADATDMTVTTNVVKTEEIQDLCIQILLLHLQHPAVQRILSVANRPRQCTTTSDS